MDRAPRGTAVSGEEVAYGVVRAQLRVCRVVRPDVYAVASRTLVPSIDPAFRVRPCAAGKEHE